MTTAHHHRDMLQAVTPLSAARSAGSDNLVGIAEKDAVR